MESSETPNEIVRRNATDLLPHDAKEVEAFSQYADKEKIKMEQLTKDIDDMGKLKSMWDSKVPEMNKRFYHFFSLKEINREEVKAEIQKYLEFYRQMSEVVPKIMNEEGTDENENVYALILELYQNLTGLAQAAETGKKTSGSSTLYDLHTTFISKHEKLENMIKRVECVSLKQSWKKATDGLQQSLKAVDGLRGDLKTSKTNFDTMCNKFDELLTQNKQLVKQQNFLLEENGKIMQQQQILLEDNKTMKKQTELLVNIITTMAKRNEKGDKDEDS